MFQSGPKWSGTDTFLALTFNKSFYFFSIVHRYLEFLEHSAPQNGFYRNLSNQLAKVKQLPLRGLIMFPVCDEKSLF